MSAQTEFGYSIPDFLSGEAWEDISWHNDIKARVRYAKSLVDDNQGTYELHVWVDYPNPEMREAGPESPLFVVSIFRYDGDDIFWREAETEEEVKLLVNMVLQLYKEKPVFEFPAEGYVYYYEVFYSTERGAEAKFLSGPIVPHVHEQRLEERLHLAILQAFGAEGYRNVQRYPVSMRDLYGLFIGGKNGK